MKKRFVVITNTSTAQQDQAFKNWLETNGFSWWHWLAEGWMVVDFRGIYSSANIREAARQCYPNINLIVIHVPQNNDWAGFGPNGETMQTNMFKWIHETWM